MNLSVNILYFCLNIPTGFSVTFVRKFFQVTHFFVRLHMKWKWCLDVIRWHYHNLRAVSKICKCKIKKTIALKRALRLVVAAFPSICTRCKKQNSGTQGNFISVLKLKTKSLEDRKRVQNKWMNHTSIFPCRLCPCAVGLSLWSSLTRVDHSMVHCFVWWWPWVLMHLVMPVHPSLPRTCHLGLPAHSLVSFFFLPLRG